MPQESCQNSFFTSPSKRGLKGLVTTMNKEASCTVTEEGFNDNEWAQRKAEEAEIVAHICGVKFLFLKIKKKTIVLCQKVDN
uniref:Uncharacterized protein n=1 Tax=Phaseolus vulgaris TaxID=3885 RepID=V7BNP9_PHAVU|nr:hypothetical protein PHAVU_006G059400g [Phaseolus vulgaris]ESW18660.1 hypothetical protein PHAVU_006G059400g [Phaseolus vulgaris]